MPAIPSSSTQCFQLAFFIPWQEKKQTCLSSTTCYYLSQTEFPKIMAGIFFSPFKSTKIANPLTAETPKSSITCKYEAFKCESHQLSQHSPGSALNFWISGLLFAGGHPSSWAEGISLREKPWLREQMWPEQGDSLQGRNPNSCSVWAVPGACRSHIQIFSKWSRSSPRAGVPQVGTLQLEGEAAPFCYKYRTNYWLFTTICSC